MAVNFRAIFSQLNTLGLNDVILPFLLLFAILFGVLQKVSIFTEKVGADTKPNKKINAIIALAISLLVVIPHVTGGYPGGVDIVDLMNRFLPQSTFVLLAVIIVLLLLGLVGVGIPSGVTWIVGGIAVLALAGIILFAVTPNRLPAWLSFLSDPALQALIIVLIVFGLIVKFVTSDDKPAGGAGSKSIFEQIAEWTKGR